MTRWIPSSLKGVSTTCNCLETDRLPCYATPEGVDLTTLGGILAEFGKTCQMTQDIFSRPLRKRDFPPKHRSHLQSKQLPWYLRDQPFRIQFSILLRAMGPRTKSRKVQLVLRDLLAKKKLSSVQQWFITADALVLPIILSHKDGHWTEEQYRTIDRIVHATFEGCSHNYDKLIARLKREKKLIRKHIAEGNPISKYRASSHRMDFWVTPTKQYLSRYQFKGLPSKELLVALQQLCLWTQTRATGLCGPHAVSQSLRKFEETISAPTRFINIPRPMFNHVVGMMKAISVNNSKLSAGPAACFQRSRSKGGRTGELNDIVQNRTLDYEFIQGNLIPQEPQQIRTAEQVLDYCIVRAILNRNEVDPVRVSVVHEPSKARVITVPTFEYVTILDYIAHQLYRIVLCKQSASGLKSSRHLWRFCTDQLDLNNKQYRDLSMDGEVPRKLFALSTDLETATDFGNLDLSREICNALLVGCAKEVPGLYHYMKIAFDLYNGPRAIHLPDGRIIGRQRGWFMGDPFTKILLTLVQKLAYMSIPNPKPVSAWVGDDLISVHHDLKVLEKHRKGLEYLDLKVSEEDTYISDRFMFFAEEMAVLPHGMNTSNYRRRRRDFLLYVDYPRLRLLLPVRSELSRHSFTMLGRFELAGKECLWANQTIDANLCTMLNHAVVIQHLLVPKDKLTHIPYAPIEIGGDGSFHPNPIFLQYSMASSPNCEEANRRVLQLLTGTWSYRFARLEHFTGGVHAYHAWIAAANEIRPLLPEECIIVPKSEEHKVLLCALKTEWVKPPEFAVMKLMKEAYFGHILSGKGIPEDLFELTLPDLSSRKETFESIRNRNLHPEMLITKGPLLERMVPKKKLKGCKKNRIRRTNIAWETVRRLVDYWHTTGFNYVNKPEFFLNTEYVNFIDHMRIRPHFLVNKDPPIPKVPPPSLRTLFEIDSDQELRQRILSGEIPVESGIHSWIDPDVYMMWEITQLIDGIFFVMTRDIKLCRKLQLIWAREFHGVRPVIVQLDPANVELPMTIHHPVLLDTGALHHLWCNDMIYSAACVFEEIPWIQPGDVSDIPVEFHRSLIFTHRAIGDIVPITTSKYEEWISTYDAARRIALQHNFYREDNLYIFNAVKATWTRERCLKLVEARLDALIERNEYLLNEFKKRKVR
nr:MAG: RNA-dependent RNA polymerase [Ips narna-like virus 2]